MRFFSCLLLLFLLYSCQKDKNTPSNESSYVETLEGEVLTHQSENSKVNNRVWQGIPSIEVDKNGFIYVVWYTGGQDEGPGNYITVSISKDFGQTWEPNAIVINPNTIPNRFFDPCLWKDNKGEIYLSWSKSKGYWDGKGGVWYSRIRYKDSIKYSLPKRLADGVMMNKPSLTLNGKSILYPISIWKKKSGTLLYKSDLMIENGLPPLFQQVSNIDISEELRTFDEHQVIQLIDNSYLMFIRCLDGIRYTKSKDLVSWSAVQNFTALGSTTPSRFSLTRLKSGRIALVMNCSTSRSNLRIFLSDDEGVSWKYSMLLDPRYGVSYPDLTQDSKGNIYIVYDYDRFKEMKINVLSFKESDILSNRVEAIKKYTLK